ncbi:MAG: alpha/beta hydrolase, partial [Alphaproteobacteria bacterium]|nr:alpha/beta hydrolase [Alphaproteobacteria bacterium]
DAFTGAEDAARAAAGPLLLVAGETDIMTPARLAAPLAKAAREARVEVIRGAGHMMMIERPDATLDVLKAFL